MLYTISIVWLNIHQGLLSRSCFIKTPQGAQRHSKRSRKWSTWELKGTDIQCRHLQKEIAIRSYKSGLQYMFILMSDDDLQNVLQIQSLPPLQYMCLCACTLSCPSHQSTTVSNMPCEQGFWQIRLNLWHTFNLQDREDLGREGYFWHMVNAQDCQRHTLSSIIGGTIGGVGSTGTIWFPIQSTAYKLFAFFLIW